MCRPKEWPWFYYEHMTVDNTIWELVNSLNIVCRYLGLTQLC